MAPKARTGTCVIAEKMPAKSADTHRSQSQCRPWEQGNCTTNTTQIPVTIATDMNDFTCSAAVPHLQSRAGISVSVNRDANRDRTVIAIAVVIVVIPRRSQTALQIRNLAETSPDMLEMLTLSSVNTLSLGARMRTYRSKYNICLISSPNSRGNRIP